MLGTETLFTGFGIPKSTESFSENRGCSEWLLEAGGGAVHPIIYPDTLQMLRACGWTEGGLPMGFAGGIATGRGWAGVASR